ncbi:hypothetical protein SRIMM317S_05120 [Streptomyces rimosus subsp. rimosus]
MPPLLKALIGAENPEPRNAYDAAYLEFRDAYVAFIGQARQALEVKDEVVWGMAEWPVAVMGASPPCPASALPSEVQHAEDFVIAVLADGDEVGQPAVFGETQ